LDTGIKTKKSNSSNSCPARYFSSNILKKMKKFQSTNFKIGDPDPFLWFKPMILLIQGMK
jgi:hypothetical protein